MFGNFIIDYLLTIEECCLKLTHTHIMLHAQLLQSCLTLCDPMDYIAHQAPLSMELSS